MKQFFLKLNLICLIITGVIRFGNGQPVVHNKEFNARFIFPLQQKHVHSSSLVELPGGDLLCCWYKGSGERSANDVQIMGARLKKGTDRWSPPFLMADTPGQPDCNPVLFISSDKRLFLFWIVVQANRWENSVLKYRVSADPGTEGIPHWSWQDVILLKPGDDFAETIRENFRKLNTPSLAWAEYAPLYERMIYEAAKDPKKRETGWIPRTHPVTLPSGRILLPLYSDGYNFSLIAISDDSGKTWQPSLPIVGRGNVQPSLVQRSDGSVVAYMRDNGDEPGRIMTSISQDNGYTWTPALKSSLPNPGSSVEALKLDNGHWIIVYNDTEHGRNSLAVSLSRDEGKSWPYRKLIEHTAKSKISFSYPSVIQRRNQTIELSYSFDNGELETIKHVSFTENWITDKK